MDKYTVQQQLYEYTICKFCKGKVVGHSSHGYRLETTYYYCSLLSGSERGNMPCTEFNYLMCPIRGDNG